MTNKFVKFKDPRQLEHILYMHPLAVIVMFDMAQWCDEREIDFTITSTISTLDIDLTLGRVSDSHRTRRAFDARSKNFTKQQKIEFLLHFNSKYQDIASIGRSSGKPNLVVLHGDGENEHFHVSLNYRFRLEEI